VTAGCAAGSPPWPWPWPWPWPSRAAPTRPRPAGVERPRRYLDGRLFSLGGVPDGGDRLALAASSSGGPDDGTGGLFVLGHHGRTWRVTGEERHWVT